MVRRAAGAEFVIRNQLGRYAVAGPAYEVALRGPAGRTFQADVYIPAGGRVPIGTIVLIHGMALRGSRDPRIIDTCRNMASEGFRVLAPHFEDIARLEMAPETIEHIADCLRAVCRRRELCPGGRLSLFAPSFSGGMALVAAAQPDVADRVNAVLALGAPGHLDSSIAHFFGSENIDDYGAMIILKNLAHYTLGKRSPLIRAFELAAIDGSWNPPPPQLPEYLATLKPKDRETFERFRTSREFRLEQIERILAKAKRETKALNVAERLSGLRCAVTLIHGRDDNVIPATESVELYNRIRALGLEVKLEITPLISHGDSAVTPGMLLKIPALIAAFGHFFGNAADRG